MDTVVVKVGGSAITRKSEGEARFREDALEKLREEIRAVYGKVNLALVIGGGAHAHIAAKRYGLGKGAKLCSGFAAGAVETHLEATRVAERVVTELLKASVPCHLLHTSSYVRVCNGEVLLPDEPIKSLIESGIVPVLHGDVCVDHCSRMYVIVSGDKLVKLLSERLNASRAVFLMDVDGVYDKDPRRFRDAKLLRTVRLSEVRRLSATSQDFDVTGGLLGKLREAFELVERGVDVYLVSIYRTNEVVSAILGKGCVTCTKLVPE